MALIIGGAAAATNVVSIKSGGSGDTHRCVVDTPIERRYSRALPARLEILMEGDIFMHSACGV